MNLVDLEPRWWAEEGRHGQGIVFLCPHCHDRAQPRDRTWLCIAFSDPLDGGAPFPIGKVVRLMERLYPTFVPVGEPVCPPGFLWTRTGDTFETLSLSPSVDASPAGCWHGFIRNGRIT